MSCLTENGREFQMQVRYTERISPHESSCTPLGHGKSEYLRLNEENENRDEATQRGLMEKLYPRQCVGIATWYRHQNRHTSAQN